MDALNIAKQETTKRIKILNKIVPHFKPYVEGIVIGGSMGYGQNIAVKESSDIDLVAIIETQNIRKFSQQKYAPEISEEAISGFENNDFDFIFTIQEIDNIETTLVLYEKEAYKNFCLNQTTIMGYSKHKPSLTTTEQGFSGEELTIDKKVKKYKNGYIYLRKAKTKNKFVLTLPAYDLFNLSQFLYEKNNYLTDIKEQTWNAVIKQLELEYGPNVNLEKHNIIKGILPRYINRIPQEIKESITKKTKELLKKK